MNKKDRYTLIRKIGQGAMGEVYLAEDNLLKRKVALKFLSLPEGLDRAARSEAHARFYREAQNRSWGQSLSLFGMNPASPSRRGQGGSPSPYPSSCPPLARGGPPPGAHGPDPAFSPGTREAPMPRVDRLPPPIPAGVSKSRPDPLDDP